MSETFKTPQEFIDAFNLQARPEYVAVSPYTNDIGFSVQRAYPKKSKFHPPTKKNGEPDSYAMVGILYEPSRKITQKPHLVPISARVLVFSRYISTHLDYDFADAECPTEESVTASKKTPKPVELSAFDSYMYDHEQDVFLDNDGHTIEPLAIIDNLYDSHLATVDRFKGVVFRWKLTSRNKFGALCEALGEVMKWLLKKICGRNLEPDEMTRGIWGDYRPEDMKLLKTESIDVFGYKASKNVIVTFCILILSGYTVIHWSAFSSSWLTGVVNNSLLAFAFSILIISFLDHALPTLFLWSINGLGRLRWHQLSKKVKFK